MLFASWAGPYGRPLSTISPLHEEEKSCTELQLSALQAMSGLLCCGPCFNPQSLSEEGAILYQWLDLLLASKDEKVIVKLFVIYDSPLMLISLKRQDVTCSIKFLRFTPLPGKQWFYCWNVTQILEPFSIG